MDFHTLTRRQLQALCKKNKIPANITNVAMADALQALPFVEGLEEFLKQSESETVKSSIESPEKSEITSPNVPRTGCTTTRSRRTTRRTLAGEVEETPAAATVAAPSTRRRAAATSIRRKIDMESKESEEVVEKQKKDIPQTPAAVPASRRKGVKETGGSVRNVYSTRRSARLAERNLDQKERSKAVKIGSFAEQVGEVIDDNTGFDLKEKSCLCVEEEKTNDIEMDVEVGQPAAEDVIETKAEIHLEMSDESGALADDTVEKLLDMEIEVQETNGFSISEFENATEKDVKMTDMDKLEDSDTVIAEVLDGKVPEYEGAAHNVKCDDSVAQQSLETMDADNSVKCGIVGDKGLVSNTTSAVIQDEIHVAVEENEPTEETSDGIAALKPDIAQDLVSATQEVDHITETLDDDAEVESEFNKETFDDNAEVKSEFNEEVKHIEETLDENAEVESDFNEEVEHTKETLDENAEVESEFNKEVEHVEETLDENAEVESNSPNHVISSNQFNQEEKPDDTEEATPVSNGVLECENPVKDANQQLSQDEITTENVVDAENSATEASSGSQTAGDVILPPLAPALLEFIGHYGASSTLAADPNEIASSGAIVRPAGLSLTPVKKNSLNTTTTTTPVKKSAGKTPKTVNNYVVTDNKENVDSGRKLQLLVTKEKPKKNKDIGGTDNNQKPLEEISLRQLSKMFKQKLEITQKLSRKEADDINVAAKTSRPALKTLSETL